NPIGTVAGPFPFASSTGTIAATQAGLDVSGQDAAPGSLPQGATAEQMLNLQVNTTQYVLALQGLTVNALGTAADSDVAELRLYKDNIGNGVLNVSSDTELASLNSPFHGGVAFLSLSPSLAVGSAKTGLILAVDISSTANYNADLGLSVSSATSISVNSPNFVVNSGFPMNSSVIPITKSPDVLSVSPQNLISSGVIQDVETPVMKITAWASPAFSVWKQADFTRIGTLPDAGVAAVKVYLDANNDGVWDGADVLIGSAAVVSGAADVQFSTAQTVGVSSSVYFVTLTPAVNAAIGDSVGLALSGASQLSVLSPDSVSGANLPFQTALAQVLDGRTPETPAVTLPSGQYDGTFDSLSFVWTSTVALGSINSASYAIGTAPGGTNVRGFTPIVPVSSTAYTATGLLLFTGTSYYVSVKVGSSLGFTSPTGASPGQLVDTTVPQTPTPLSLTPGQTTVIASWPAASAGPSGIRGYLLQYMNLDSPVWYNAKTQGQTVQAQGVYAPQSLNVSTSALVAPPVGVDNLPAGTYLFEVQSVSGAGLLSSPSSPVRVLVGSTPTSDFSNLSSYPNPFDSRSGQATIVYDLAQNEDVSIKIFDVFGGLVRSMHYSSGGNGGLQGTNSVTWDGTDNSGRKVSKGIYIAVFQSGGGKTTYKIGVIH
ncbi:MAG: T9SS type A sorting domain-containing protein, partial [Elusimicrobia bacterium]|nr:T9SS type A sorting domain-containing protein [Elusimicrobiota bacterium]